jgi:molybdenum cofactor guanylyltransferase
MGRDKASLLWEGATLLERTVEQLDLVSREVIVVGRQSAPEGARALTDREPGLGPVGGLVTGLHASRYPLSVVVACDHPFLDAALLRALVDCAGGFDAVVPRVEGTAQPLVAVYRRACVGAVEQYLRTGGRSLQGLLPHLMVRWVEEAELAPIDPDFRSFRNVNTPGEWAGVSTGDTKSSFNHGRME